MTHLFPGDLLLVRTGGLAGRLIRLGAALRDQVNLDNHVAVVHHVDQSGTVWAVEGRPGGVGWVDASHYLNSRWGLNNARQDKTDEQREAIAKVVVGMLGTPYDWEGIVADAMTAIDAQALWGQDWHGQGAPGHVVCSSLAAYAYDKVGLAWPREHSVRMTTPADWEDFVLTGNYSA